MSAAGVVEGTLGEPGRQTWYRVTGPLPGRPGGRSDRLPVVVLHGGPGAAHDYCLAMTSLAEDGRAIVHYDQLGCGRSSHLPDADPSMWTVGLFVDELRRVVGHLGLERFHLLGQSWGGMLGPEVVLSDSTGIASLTVCDSPASMELWLQAANSLRDELPAEVQQTLLRHESAGSTDSAEYHQAMDVFYARHVCRVQPLPAEVAASFAQIEAEPTVYHTMNGPSEFHVVGSLKDWTVVDRLGRLDVPTLVVAGHYDEATPITWQPFLDRVPDVVGHVFAHSSHMPHVEENAEFTRLVGAFLRAHDPR